ncbi:hypothetical protein DF3PB_6110002 [uncultured Defluviicoccus sp.]|uniref:Uncharacterized protein n=1 Tax=metagenome TaxID=256318 RepID=A0A380TIX0_9ZZZZ|nr:hypothetical protein DF3PB_6110002 [uncultured Defluviicoccus sp.]
MVAVDTRGADSILAWLSAFNRVLPSRILSTSESRVLSDIHSIVT